MTLPSSLRAHPLWPLLLPFVKAEPSGSNFRLEMRQLPNALARQVLGIKVGCIECGREIQPVRQRKGHGNKRSERVGHSFYVAAACPMSVHIGCSRGTKARDEYVRIRQLAESYHSRPAVVVSP